MRRRPIERGTGREEAGKPRFPHPCRQAQESRFCNPAREKAGVSPSGRQTARPNRQFPPTGLAAPRRLRFPISKAKPPRPLRRQEAARFAPSLSCGPAERNARWQFSPTRPAAPPSFVFQSQKPKPRILSRCHCNEPFRSSCFWPGREHGPPAGNFPNQRSAPGGSASLRSVPPRSSAASSASGRTASARACISPASACVCSSRRARAGASSAVKTP